MKKQQLIDQFDKNAMENIKINLQEWKGKKYIDMRVWVKADNSESDEDIATKKGLTLSIDLIPELIEALQKAQKAIQMKPINSTGDTIS